MAFTGVRSNVISDYRITSPRVCSKCLGETEHIKAIWDFTPVTFCTKHEVLLTDVCPTCSAKLSWTRHRLLECPNRHDLRHGQVRPVSPAHVQAAHDAGLIDAQAELLEGGTQCKTRLTIVQSIARRLYRPVDVIPADPQLNELPNALLHPLYTEALKLALDPCAAGRHARQADNAIHRSFPQLGLALLGDAASPDPDLASEAIPDTVNRDNFPELTDAQRYGVLPLRLNAARRVAAEANHLGDGDPIEMALRAQVSLDMLCESFGVAARDIHSLTEYKLLYPVHSDTPRYQDWLFDIRDLESMLERIPVRQLAVGTSPERYHSIKNLFESGVARKHNVTLGHLLEGVHQGQLTAWKSGAGHLNSLLLDADAVHIWLSREFERPRDTYSVAALTALLDTLRVVVSALSHSRYIPVRNRSRRSRKPMKISLKSVANFRCQYLLLNPIANALNSRALSLVQNLTAMGFDEPDVIKGRCLNFDVFVARRTPELVDELTRRLIEAGSPVHRSLRLSNAWLEIGAEPR